MKPKMSKLNPQQQAFKEAYCNPNSPTFGNALQSGLKAGFTEEYSKVITAQGTEWFSEMLRDQKMLGKAEKVLNDTLDIDHIEPVISLVGVVKDPVTKEPLMKANAGLLKIKQDSAKFVAETLGKEKYSKRSELTAKDGAPLANSIEGLPPEAIAEMRAVYEEAMKKKLTKSE